LVFAQKTPGYTFHQINYPGLEHTYVFDVNDRASAGGDVVGVAHRLNEWGSFEPVHFTKYGSAYLPFIIEGTEYAYPDAINNHRVVAGVFRILPADEFGWSGFAHIGSSREHATVETERIEPPNGYHTSATGINDAGTVVGYYWSDGFEGAHGFILDGDTYIDLPRVEGWEIYPLDINNLGQVVGNAYDRATGESRLFLYREGQLEFFSHPESTSAYANGINDHGHIVGSRFVLEWGDPDDEEGGKICCWRGFLLRNGVFTTINVTNDAETSVAGINNQGTIVGTFFRPGDGWKAHGFRAVPKPPKVASK
jgi:probable HAF family extracellular repeat protein